MSAMQTSPNGRKMIESFEGLRLSAYRDSVGIPTIGYGHTADVHDGDVITQEQADDFLAVDLHQAETALYKALWGVALTQNQFDALVSLTYNIGGGAFKKSTIVKKILERDMEGAADHFLDWNKAGGKVVQGLANRRAAERALFLTPETQ